MTPGLSAPGADAWFSPGSTSVVVAGENLAASAALPSGAFSLVYLDPPFNTGRVQRKEAFAPAPAAASDVDEAGAPVLPGGSVRAGFRGESHARVRRELARYDDAFEDFWGFLYPRLQQAWRLLAADGTLYLHLDYREAHYAKVAMDALVGRDKFLNEIVWAYDYGSRTKRRWPAKHDTILVYVKDPARYHFDSAAVDREPYMAPGLVTPEKAERGKLPTDVWWHTIVSPTGHEKTGYPSQKPLGVLRRIVQASSREGDWVLDLFAGSGTTGAAAEALGRRFVCVDSHPDAVTTMRRRLPGARFVDLRWDEREPAPAPVAWGADGAS